MEVKKVSSLLRGASLRSFRQDEEWLAYRDAQQGNSRLITKDVSEAVVIDEPKEH
jgi:hypothetical protein